MKRIILMLMMATGVMTSLAITPIDSLELRRLQQMADSVVDEARRLYLYEYLAWHSADELTKHKVDVKKIGMGGVTVDDNGIMHYIYVDKKGELLLDYVLDPQSMFSITTTKKRALDNSEMQAMVLRTQAIKTVVETCGDSILNYSSADGTLNFDVIPMDNGRLRMYIIQGTTHTDVQPFGNDYVIDLDGRLQVTSFRRLHNFYIEIPIGNDSNSISHRHAPDSEMITATDIVSFMLYGHDLFGLGSTYVTFKPHADSEGYVVVFDANRFKAVVMTLGMVEKFVNENKKDK